MSASPLGLKLPHATGDLYDEFSVATVDVANVAQSWCERPGVVRIMVLETCMWSLVGAMGATVYGMCWPCAMSANRSGQLAP
eukprot:7489865-Alexandrium_andersonii.AAC.1